MVLRNAGLSRTFKADSETLKVACWYHLRVRAEDVSLNSKFFRNQPVETANDSGRA